MKIMDPAHGKSGRKALFSNHRGVPAETAPSIFGTLPGKIFKT
jgi:hypothetical protein